MTRTAVRDGIILRSDTAPALLVAWAEEDTTRVGEVFCVPAETGAPAVLLGRGPSRADDPYARVMPIRQRPGENLVCAPLNNARLSRQQLAVRADGEQGVLVENLGRCPMRVNGRVMSRATVRPGQVIELEGQLLLLCTVRPRVLPALEHWPVDRIPDFGAADMAGAVGESPSAWALRDELALIAGHDTHVLVLGESGTGKELAAGTIHALSRRGRRTMVSRNAATFPSTLVDAELFGNVKGFPNPGMPERPGIVGAADGTTLLLDEIGELPIEMQSHLLRVLDDAGEYQRLGDSKMLRTDLRLIAATNRRVEELRQDFAARLVLRVRVPSLRERRDDIPLLARQLAKKFVRDQSAPAARFLDVDGEPRISIRLMAALVCHDFRNNVRELQSLLWTSMRKSRGEKLEFASDVQDAIRNPAMTVSRSRVCATELGETASIPRAPTADEIQHCLDRCGGVQEVAWRELGLSSRYALRRLMQRHRISSPASERRERPLPTKEQVVAAMDRCNGVAELAWRDLGLSSRFALVRLRKKHGLI